MKNDICLDMIISLLKGIKQGHNSVISGSSRIRNAGYLLGQMVRQYAIPNENHWISKEAKQLWARISDDNIWNYTYTNRFTVKADIILPKYVGAEGRPRGEIQYKKGEKVEFKSIFHDEHIISIEVIIKQLKDVPEEELSYNKVKSILDSIVVCRILKEEDKKLQRKRYATFDENYERIYKPNEVICENAADEYSKRKNKDKL